MTETETNGSVQQQQNGDSHDDESIPDDGLDAYMEALQSNYKASRFRVFTARSQRSDRPSFRSVELCVVVEDKYKILNAGVTISGVVTLHSCYPSADAKSWFCCFTPQLGGSTVELNAIAVHDPADELVVAVGSSAAFATQESSDVVAFLPDASYVLTGGGGKTHAALLGTSKGAGEASWIVNADVIQHNPMRPGRRGSNTNTSITTSRSVSYANSPLRGRSYSGTALDSAQFRRSAGNSGNGSARVSRSRSDTARGVKPEEDPSCVTAFVVGVKTKSGEGMRQQRQEPPHDGGDAAAANGGTDSPRLDDQSSTRPNSPRVDDESNGAESGDEHLHDEHRAPLDPATYVWCEVNKAGCWRINIPGVGTMRHNFGGCEHQSKEVISKMLPPDPVAITHQWKAPISMWKYVRRSTMNDPEVRYRTTHDFCHLTTRSGRR